MKPDGGSRKWFTRIARRLFRSDGDGASPDANRRIMPVAVVNCVGDGPLNGNSNAVPVTAFAKMFLSHPAEDGSVQTIFAEVVGVPGKTPSASAN